MKFTGYLNSKKRKKPQKLTLKIRSEDMFDPMVITPHSEINGGIFARIDRFSTHAGIDSDFSIAIYTDTTLPIIQEKFRELFIEHYEDDLRTVKKKLGARYMMIFLFILLSTANIVLWNHLRGRVMLNVFQNVWAFMLWKIGDTFIDGIRVWQNYRRIINIKRAKITFYRIKVKKYNVHHDEQEE